MSRIILIVALSALVGGALMVGGSGVDATHGLHTEPGHRIDPPNYFINHDLLPGDGHGAHDGGVAHDVHDGVLDIVLCPDENWNWGSGFNQNNVAFSIELSWGALAKDYNKSFSYDTTTSCLNFQELNYDLALHSVEDTTNYCDGRHLGCYDAPSAMIVSDNKYHNEPGLPVWIQVTWARVFFDRGLVNAWNLSAADKAMLADHEVGHTMAVWHTVCSGSDSVMQTVTVCAPVVYLSEWDAIESRIMYHWGPH